MEQKDSTRRQWLAHAVMADMAAALTACGGGGGGSGWGGLPTSNGGSSGGTPNTTTRGEVMDALSDKYGELLVVGGPRPPMESLHEWVSDQRRSPEPRFRLVRIHGPGFLEQRWRIAFASAAHVRHGIATGCEWQCLGVPTAQRDRNLSRWPPSLPADGEHDGVDCDTGAARRRGAVDDRNDGTQ